jgi:hypothetical protein
MLLLLPVTVNAQLNIQNPVGDAFKDFPTAINTLSRWVRSLAVLGYIGMVLYAGYIRMTAGADPEKAKKSMQILMYSTTGFILILLAPIIISTIAAIFDIDLITN